MTRPDRGLPEAPPAIESQRLSPERVAAVYAELGVEIRAFLLGLTRDPEQSEELLQATFGRLVEVGHTARDESLRGWLFRVAYNEALLVRRRQATGERILMRTAWSREATTVPAEEPLVQAETVQRVRQAIAELPPEQQQIVRLRIYDNKTFAAIAAELKIPLGTALGRMQAALTKLRVRLGEHDELDS